jgi:hypothetical protein
MASCQTLSKYPQCSYILHTCQPIYSPQSLATHLPVSFVEIVPVPSALAYISHVPISWCSKWPQLEMVTYWTLPSILKAPTFCIHVNKAIPHKDIRLATTLNELLMNKLAILKCSQTGTCLNCCGQSKSQILHLLHCWWIHYCFAETLAIALSLSLAPHNSRTSQVDPNAIPSGASRVDPNAISLPPPPVHLLLGQRNPIPYLHIEPHLEDSAANNGLNTLQNPGTRKRWSISNRFLLFGRGIVSCCGDTSFVGQKIIEIWRKSWTILMRCGGSFGVGVVAGGFATILLQL